MVNKYNDIFIDLNNDLLTLLSGNSKFNISTLFHLGKAVTFNEIKQNIYLLNNIIVPNIYIRATSYEKCILINRMVLLKLLNDSQIKTDWSNKNLQLASAYKKYDIYFCELIHEILEKYKVNIIIFCKLTSKGLTEDFFYSYNHKSKKYTKI